MEFITSVIRPKRIMKITVVCRLCCTVAVLKVNILLDNMPNF